MVLNQATGRYQIIKEGREEILRVDATSWNFVPSIEDNAIVMSWTIDRLTEVPSVSRIVFSQRRNYSYDNGQTQMLVEIANIYKMLVNQKKILSLYELSVYANSYRYIDAWRQQIQNIILNLLRSDPIGAYVETKRFLREELIRVKHVDLDDVELVQSYIDILKQVYNLLDNTSLIKQVINSLAGYKIGEERNLYSLVFRPSLSPDFMFTRLMARHPLEGKDLDIYKINNSEVYIYDVPGDIKPLYHLTPPEFKLTEDKYELLDLARNVLAGHKPNEEEFLDPERMRRTFFNIGRDLLRELADRKNVSLNYEELNELADILVRYTVGFGLVEVLLQDKKIQDININSPIGQSPIFVLHEDYDECLTNIIPSVEDSESWATKFRLLSGRPLDEANPVLDTELSIPGARARVAIVQKPLNPYGIAFAFRRHRDMPWTYPLFIKNKMMTPFCAGLLSFLIDGSRSMLFAGTRSSGKTSLLGASLLEIMRKYRIISVEDSVSGDAEILFEKNGIFVKSTIGKLIDDLVDKYGCWYNLSGHEVLGNDEDIKVFSMDNKGKIRLSRVSKFVRHKVSKPLYEITTRTGRRIKVTGDHSLFSLGDNAEIKAIKAGELKVNDFIATPRKIYYGKETNTIRLLDHIDKINKGYLNGEEVKSFLLENKFEIKQLGKEYGHNRSLRANWIREGYIPIKILKDMDCLGYNIKEIKEASFKYSHISHSIPTVINLDKELLSFFGLWIADGCYDRRSIIMSVSSKEERELVYKIANRFGFNVKMHSDAFSLMINSDSFKFLMREILDFRGNAYTKRIPNWVFNLSKEQIGYVLKGIFSGDGCVADKEIVIPLSSLGLLKDIQTLLLGFGIILRVGKMRKDKTYNASISSLKSWNLFKEIGLLQDEKIERLSLLCSKISNHDVTDIIPLTLNLKIKLKETYPNFNYTNYLSKQNSNFGRNKLGVILEEIPMENDLINNLKSLTESDLFWDQIREIKCISDYKGFVYDISVPENESFVCENIIAHNTLELNFDVMRNIGYNVQSFKVRSALTKGGTEVEADEGIRTSLRMGDSSLIVGEIRSSEAFALYEAMRIGALANVVAGTIHGDSPYGVFDRVVNDLKVPRTSFKATDVIIVANPVKSPDGLHKWRRITQVTEVRKHWEEDPLREKGFVDVLKYDPKNDSLEIMEDLINGEIEVLKNIAGNVKEWAGNWDAILENINLRAKIKKTLVDYSEKSNMLELLEANFVVDSNDQFHIISNKIKEEIGSLESKRIFFEWEDWLKSRIREIKFRG